MLTTWCDIDYKVMVHHHRAHPRLICIPLQGHRWSRLLRCLAQSQLLTTPRYPGNRRTIGEWFRAVTTKRSHNRTPRQTPSESPPQSGIPSQTKATPSKEKPSTMSAGKRQQVSVPSSVDTVHGLTILLSGRLEGPLSDHRLVHPTYPFTNIMTYRVSQKIGRAHV